MPDSEQQPDQADGAAYALICAFWQLVSLSLFSIAKGLCNNFAKAGGVLY